MHQRQWLSREARAVVAVSGTPDPVSGMKVLASGLIDEAAITQPPFDPVILASFQNVREVRMRPMQSAARLVPEPATRTLLIEVNQDHSPGKRNFSVNHETSHTLVPTYAGRLIDDLVTGQFVTGSEEEYLCDVGAATLLMDERWLRPLAREAGPSLDTLFTFAGLFGASLEATARKLARLDIWPCAFVCWEEGLRKHEHVSDGQLMIESLATYGMPQPQLRVTRLYKAPSFSLFIPNNKSVGNDSLVAACCDDDPVTFGMEVFEFERNRPETLYSENAHVPYRVQGELRRRVISLLIKTGTGTDAASVPELFRLEDL